MEERKIKEINVMKEDWNYLIILDACRYDFFSELYKEYLKGKLKKVISPGSCTIEWCKKSFKDYYDVIYISANPYINSKIEVENFNAKKHFYKIIDVWYWGWNEKLGTVHPKKVNEAVRKFKDNYPDKRFIIHYLQPHEPYLCYKPHIGFRKPTIGQTSYENILGGINNSHNRILTLEQIFFRLILPRIGRVHAVLRYLAKRLFNGNPIWKFKKLLNLPPSTPMDAIRRSGDEILRKMYVENLKFVLNYVTKLIEDLYGVIVITTDHGELLGEDNHYGHDCYISNPLLKVIPWFIVKNVKKIKKSCVHERRLHR